ncbi:MAG TPA: N-acetylmuramoyl-L-alanine amidase [Acidimicrobiales bacterium]|jgi:N-acetylmuramoyl-L-alanine amidase|nr:N-acetylmuramoyl-L-alanine amidase [Acidimicrobiales bacterium]
MITSSRVLVGLVVLACLGAGCSKDQVAADPADTNTPGSPSTVGATVDGGAATPTGSTTPPPTTRPLPELPAGGALRAVQTATGVTAAVSAVRADGSIVVVSPCGRDVAVRGATPIRGAHVVLDPGHGGSESGAVGPGGLKESELNLAVAQETKRILEAAGVAVVLSRTADYRITLASRARIATALGAAAFVSIHHNAGPDHQQGVPGTEVYYQAADERASKRLAGLVHEEVVAALSPYALSWSAFRDAGVKIRVNQQGEDYYGILRSTAGVPSALAELAYVTNAPEEVLLKTAAFRTVEAQAVARGIVRFLTTDDPGSGFVGPSDRTEPAGPGGGSQGCVDPPL